MRKGSINILELHVEKIVLGVAGLFAAYMLVMYVFTTPHQVEYGNTTVTPDTLDQAIADKGSELKRALDQKSPKPQEIPDYPTMVRRQLVETSVLNPPGEDTPPLPETLPLAATFGAPIAIPGASADGARNIELVRPLAPAQPVVQVGRSRVAGEPIVIQVESDDRAARAAADADEGPTRDEVGWVTIAAYWNRGEQRDRHKQAGYVNYREKPYVARVEVQRQELTPAGVWSDWEVLRDSPAMPQIDIPEPEYDEFTGRAVNKGVIDATFQLIKQQQLDIMQPLFPTIEVGDRWYVPPLDGFTAADWRAKEEQAEQLAAAGEEGRDRDDRFAPPGGGAAPPNFNPYAQRQGGGGPMFGGSPGGGPPGMMSGNRQRNDDRRRERRSGRDEAEATFQQARVAFSAGQLDQAKRMLDEVLEGGELRRSDERNAESLRDKVDHEIKQRRYNSPRDANGPRTVSRGDQNPKVFAVWFHDTTALPGRTYRYRLRVCLWNRYVNQPDSLANPQMAEQVILEGEWSPATDPVTPIPGTRAYFTRAYEDQNAVRAEVWKWHEGWWVKEDFDVRVGERVGGVKRTRIVGQEEPTELDFTTDLVVLDVRFGQRTDERSESNDRVDYRPRETDVVVFLDTRDDTVHETPLADRVPDLNFAAGVR